MGRTLLAGPLVSYGQLSNREEWLTGGKGYLRVTSSHVAHNGHAFIEPGMLLAGEPCGPSIRVQTHFMVCYPMHFGLVDLQTFVAVAEAGSLTHGAARVNLSLAAVSARIRQMEEAVGVPLLERRPHGIRVTEAGQTFLRHARTTLGALQRMTDDLAQFSQEGRCTCGRELQRLARVDGRLADTMRTMTGAPVPGMLFISLLNAHEAEVREFQAVQRASGAVELRVVPGREWSKDAFAATAERLARYFGGLPFEVVLVSAIEADASGKRRHVIVERH